MIVKRISGFLEGKFFIFCFAVLAGVSVINGYFHTVLNSDGLLWFYDALLQNIAGCPTDSRIFAQVLLWTPIIWVREIFAITDLKTIVRLQSFWHSFLPVIFIGINYFLLPKNKKNWIVFPLLSFLICKNFIPFTLWHTSHVAAAIFFAVFATYLVSDIKTISPTRLVILNILSFLLIRSYESAVFFAPIIMGVIIYKYACEKSISTRAKVLLLTNAAILLVCVIYQIYVIANPVHAGSGIKDSLISCIGDTTIQAVFLVTAVAVVFSFINVKNKYFFILNALFAVGLVFFAVFLYENLLFFSYFDATSIMAYSNRNRALNIIAPLAFSGLMVLLYLFRLDIRFYMLQLLTFALLLSFVVNSTYLGAQLDFELRQKTYLLQSVTAKVKMPSGWYSSKSILSLFLPSLYAKNSSVKSVLVLPQGDRLYGCVAGNIASSVDTLPDLSRFGINYCESFLNMLRSDTRQYIPFEVLKRLSRHN
ncbi:MAG: hypothetical protein FWC85_01735 [Elusimicrobia bacterium]|nr:hypothetical protein [Elusimicrobiota bacterium]